MKSQQMDIASVSCYLSVTANIATMLEDKFLRTNRDSIGKPEVYHALFDHKEAYNLIRDYGYIANCVHLLEERISEAVKMLDDLEQRIARGEDVE